MSDGAGDCGTGRACAEIKGLGLPRSGIEPSAATVASGAACLRVTSRPARGRHRPALVPICGDTARHAGLRLTGGSRGMGLPTGNAFTCRVAAKAMMPSGESSSMPPRDDALPATEGPGRGSAWPISSKRSKPHD